MYPYIKVRGARKRTRVREGEKGRERKEARHLERWANQSRWELNFFIETKRL